MKNLFKVIFLLPFFTMAQINIDNQWKTSVNPIFQNLDKTKIQSKLLLDYAMEFTDVTAYNGVLTDTTFVDANIMGDIYKTIFMSKVVADTVTTPLFDRYAYNWTKARFKATKDSSSVYILSGLLYEYQRFNPNALAQNKISIISNKYYDKYIGGVWQNPYETRKTFALTTPIQQSRSKKVYFKLPNNLLLSNIKNQIASIQINADNGLGYVNFPYDTALQLQFFENKIHNITYKITLTNSQVLLCRSKFKIDDPTLDNLQQRGAIPVTNERVYIHEDGDFFNAAWLTIKRIPGNTGITRPFIIAEGLDTGNFTAPEVFGGDLTMQNFINDVNSSQSDNFENLLINNGTQQYDLIYIDWVRGMADMRSNSKVLEEVIKWVNNQKVISGSTQQPNVLLGQSMGGVIGRYTLARMEKEYKPHNVRLFIAHDSPMQGASTPIGIQHFSVHMRQLYTSTPLTWGFGDVLIPLSLNLAQIGEQFLNLFGVNNNNIPAYVTPSQLLSLQDQTASRQLNYWSVLNNQTKTRNFNLDWQNTLTTMGWPQLSRNVAISNGNECNVSGELVPGAPLIIIDSKTNPGFFLDALSSLLAPTTALITNDIGLLIVSAIPGNSKWQTNFNINTSGNLGSQNLIYFGRIRYSKKFLWIGPTINYDLTNQSHYSPIDALPFESYSGGQYRLTSTINNLPPILTNIIDYSRPSYGFIPTVSALDIKRNNGQVIPSDYLKKYAGGVTPESALTTGFHNFIVDYNSGNTLNNKHISFQVRNGNWLAEELNVNATNPTYPVYNCLFICNDAKINGADVLCTTATYNAPTGAPLYNWSITQGSNLITLTGNGTPSVTITSLPNVSGAVTLSLTMGDDGVKCGNITLNKTIWVGVPKFNSLEPIGNQNGYNPNEPNLSISPDGDGCNQIKLKAIFDSPSILEYQWEKITTDVSWSVSPNSGLIYLYPQCNQNFSFKVRVRNSCGWSEWYQFDYFMNRCTIACNTSIPIINTGLNFTLNPNPVTNEILNINVKNNAPWFIIPVNIGNGNNFDISNEFGETNYQLIPNISVNISIFNQLGTPVLQFPNMPVHPTPAELNLSSLQSGTYMVVFEYEGQEESYTIIKN